MADNEVQTKFGAQIDGLVAGVEQVKEQVESLTAPIEAVNTAFKSLGEAVVAGLAVEKIDEAMDKFAELGEQIKRTSEITGLSTDDVQRFQYAIRMSGGDAETAGITIGIFQKNIAEASSGAGTAAQAFSGLGVSVKDSVTGATRPAIDILNDLAEVFPRVADANLRAEYARALFGRGYQNLLPILLEGRKGLEELSKQLDQTGSKLSPGLVNATDELAKHTKTLDTAWGGLANSIKTAVLPVYDELIQKTTAATEKTTSYIQFFSSLPKLAEISRRIHDSHPDTSEGGWQGSVGHQDKDKDYGVQFGPPAPIKLPPLKSPTGDGAGDEDDKTQDQIDRSNYQTSLEVDKLRLEGRKETDQAMVDSGQMTAARQIADLQQMAAEEYAIEIQAVDKLASTYDSDSAEYAELQNKKLVLAQQFANEQAKLVEQQAANQKKQYDAELAPWKQLMGDMGGAADTMINGVLSGTQTFKQALSKAFDDLGIRFSEVMAKMLAEFAVFEATSGKGFLGFGSSNPFAALSTAFTQVTTQMSASWAETQAKNLISAQTTDTAVVGANAAANAAIAASNTAGAAVSNAPAAAAAKANISTQAASAAASVYADVAAIPYVGWVLAPPAAAAAFAAVEAFGGGIASYDVGSWNIPSDQVAMVHAGEMIIPAAQAAAIRGGGASLGGGGGGGSSQGFTININAIDTQTGAQFLKNNASVIASTLSGQMRNLNPRLQS